MNGPVFGDTRAIDGNTFEVYDGNEWIFGGVYGPAAPRVHASATVDQLRAGPVPLWEVTVTGLAPHDHRRTYQIEANTDNKAANDGIGQFVAEMENLDS